MNIVYTYLLLFITSLALLLYLAGCKTAAQTAASTETAAPIAASQVHMQLNEIPNWDDATAAAIADALCMLAKEKGDLHVKDQFKVNASAIDKDISYGFETIDVVATARMQNYVSTNDRVRVIYKIKGARQEGVLIVKDYRVLSHLGSLSQLMASLSDSGIQISNIRQFDDGIAKVDLSQQDSPLLTVTGSGTRAIGPVNW